MNRYSRADLHVHSDASDGVHSSPELVRKAESARLSHIAICDHDTTAGITDALQYCKNSDINTVVVPAVEIGTELSDSSMKWARTSRLQDGEVHILGYGIDPDPDDEQLDEMLEHLQDNRHQRLLSILHNFRKMGMYISEDEVNELSGDSQSPGRPHVAKMLVHRGYCEDVPEAFEKFLSVGRPGYVPRERPDSRKAVEAICQAGGMAILAHPGLLTRPLDMVKLLQEQGISGVEVVHQNHSFSDVSTLIRHCRRRGLLCTGGSDYHGRKRDPEIGEIGIPRQWAETMLEEIHCNR